jgi:hypothetical protein
MDRFRELVTPRHLMAMAFFYAMGVLVLLPCLPGVE